MPHAIRTTNQPATVTDTAPAESAATPTSGEHPQHANPPSDHPQPHATDRDTGDAPIEPADPAAPAQKRHRRSRAKPARINANTVIGALIGVIGVVIVFVLAYGIQSINTRFDDMNASIDARFDDMYLYINARFDDQDKRLDDMIASVDARFDDVNKRLDAMDDRLAVVEADIKGLRQDINDTNARLDLLIAVLEATQAIPADVVPKSTTPALAALSPAAGPELGR